MLRIEPLNKQTRTKKATINNTYLKCNSSCLDNKIINRDLDLFWKDKEETVWGIDNNSKTSKRWACVCVCVCIWSILLSLLDTKAQAGWGRPATAANFNPCPLVQYQTVMNAVSRIINDLTVKSFCSWTMRLRKNNRGERIPRYTHNPTNRSGMAVPFPSSESGPDRCIIFV